MSKIAGGMATARNIVGVIALTSLFGATFYGGRMSTTAGFMSNAHSVIDAALSCDEGSYIGGCTECSACPTHGADDGTPSDSSMFGLYFKYPTGGCSYFKDTLCSYCDAIGNCDEDFVTCTNLTDAICHKCEEDFWDTDCKECTDCGKTHWVETPCQQTSDAVCIPCKPCADEEFIDVGCTKDHDSECKACTVCATDQYQVEGCQVDADTVCAPCTVCMEGDWQKVACGFDTDTTCNECGQCEFAYNGKGEIVEALEYIEVPCAFDANVVCAECTHPQAYKWRVTLCGGDKDATYAACTVCALGQYEDLPCQFSQDTTCPECTLVPGCLEGQTRCHNDIDQHCEGCEDGYIGLRCCYQRSFTDCNAPTTRERSAIRGGFKGKSDADFIYFCMDMCEELPDCVAFEVIDGGADDTGSGDNSLTVPDATCYFKTERGEEAGTDPEKDCYSNVCGKEAVIEGRDMSRVVGAADKVIEGPDTNIGNAGVGAVRRL